MSAYSRFVRVVFPYCTAAVLLAWGMSVRAVEMMDGKLQLHGFLTQGVVSTSHNNFMGSSEDQGSLDFREIGVNFSLRATPDLQVSGQLLSHRSGEMDDGRIQLDYGMVDWTVVSGEKGRAGVRLGRVKLPYGFYNETRDVAHTRPAAVLPQPIYFEMTRNLQMSADGVGIYLEHYGESGNFYASYQGGYPQAKGKSVEAAFFGRDQPGKFDSRFSQLINLTYEGDGGRYRLGLTSAWVRAGALDLVARAADAIADADVLGHAIEAQQAFALAPARAVLACVAPAPSFHLARTANSISQTPFTCTIVSSTSNPRSLLFAGSS